MNKSGKDKSFIFRGEMVRAIGDGSKTQTRRIIRPQPHLAASGSWGWQGPGGLWLGSCAETLRIGLEATAPFQPGDIVRVKETFAAREDIDGAAQPVRALQYTHYRADETGWYPRDVMNWHYYTGWTPSIHMPRWASRYFLEILSVRAERVQEITEAGAMAEGCQHCCNGADCGCRGTAAIGDFIGLWNSLYAAPKRKKRNPYTHEREECYVSYPWEDVRKTETLRGLPHYIIGNGWVYAYTFKRSTSEEMATSNLSPRGEAAQKEGE